VFFVVEADQITVIAILVIHTRGNDEADPTSASKPRDGVSIGDE
jgi:hypothetical protein